MRRDVQEIFRNTPHSKQVMMFSATLSKDIRPVCKKFMQDVSGQPIIISIIHTSFDNILSSLVINRHNYLQWGRMGGECFKQSGSLIRQKIII